MTILLISLHADPTVPAGVMEGGGTHSYVRELMAILAAKQIKNILITRQSAPELAEYDKISEYGSIYRIKAGEDGVIDKKQFYFLHDEICLKALKIVKSLTEQPDVIHSIYWNSGQIACYLSSILKIPFVHSVISNGLRRSLSGAQETLEARFEAELQVFREAQYIFCITESERRDLETLYHISRHKLIIPGRPVPEAFSNPAHDTLGIPNRHHMGEEDNIKKSDMRLNVPASTCFPKAEWWAQKAFLYYGRIAQSKGIDVIVQAWARLYECYGEQCPPLWLAGGLPSEIQAMRESILPLVEKLECYEQMQKIIWWGYLNQWGISTLLLRSLAMIMHSMYEPGGRVIIESLSEGVPVIATPNGFGADYIKDWFNGFIVDYGNIDDLFHKMNHFARQPYLSNNLGLHAKHFSAEVIKHLDFAGTHIAVYTNTVKKTRYEKRELSAELMDAIYQHKRIHIFPYFNETISNRTMRHLMGTLLQDDVSELRCHAAKKHSSTLWSFVTGKIELLAKQPYTKLTFDLLYDQLSDRPVIEGARRYATEKASSALKGLAPIAATDDLHQLIVRKRYSLATEKIPEIFTLARLARIPLFEDKSNSPHPAGLTLCESMHYFERDWSVCGDAELAEGYRKHHHLFFSTTWSLDVPFSLPFHLERTRRNLARCHYNLPETVRFMIERLLNTTSMLIPYCDLPQYTVCIGNPYVKHLIYDDDNGQVLFVDGECVHIGEGIRDFSVFLCSLTEHFHCQSDMAAWKSLIPIFMNGQRNHNRLLCWLMLTTAEELLKESIMQNLDCVKTLEGRADVLLRLSD